MPTSHGRFLEKTTMKRKPIRIDWDELEQAFDNKREDLVYYLDLVTGQVVLEGEGGDLDDDDDLLGEAAELEPPAREEAGHRLYVETPDLDAELTWMSEFVRDVDDLVPEVRDKLAEVLDREDPDAFRDALRPHAEVRDRWFLYRSERLHEAIDAWLGEHGVQIVEPPPWR